jgi:hypothetical protein
MYHGTPVQGERYYVRLLLTIKIGFTSFEDLRMVDGRLYPTFREACKTLGLLDDDREWYAAFEESKDFAIGAQLRNLFVVALTSGNVADPAALWEQFNEHICFDLHPSIRVVGESAGY